MKPNRRIPVQVLLGVLICAAPAFGQGVVSGPPLDATAELNRLLGLDQSARHGAIKPGERMSKPVQMRYRMKVSSSAE